MHRERPTTDLTQLSGLQLDGLPASAYVPIESDADAGFLQRTRKARAARPVISTGKTLEDIPQSVRRRRIVPRNQDSSPEPSSTSPSSPKTSTQQASDRPSTFGETLRHVRTQSMQALTSPFRGSPSRMNVQPAEPSRKRSGISISRWFGNASETDTEDELDPMNVGGTRNGEQTPKFSLGGTAIADDPSSMDEAAALDETPRTGESGSGPEGRDVDPDHAYSPPQQDAS